LVFAFLAVFVQLNYVQIFAAEGYVSNQSNIRSLLAKYSVKRGDIVTRDGVTVAASKATKGRFKYQRNYPQGELFAHVTGYDTVNHGNSRIESTFNDQLQGQSGVLSMQDIQDRLFDSGEQGDDVRLTIHSELQEVARQALGNERGAIVAIEPSTGDVKAMWSNPSYDPNGLAVHDSQQEQKFWDSLDPASASSPLVSRATSRSYPPGSTFKVVTTGAALESGRYDPDSTFPDPVELELPLTDETLQNFSKTSCLSGGEIDLFTALVVSCDTTYGILGLKIPNETRDVATGFGFNEPIPFDVGTEASIYPKVPDDEAPLRAYAALGQGDTAATPLQMAQVAAGIANGGTVMRPRLVTEVIDASGGIVRQYRPEALSSPLSPQTAGILREMMVEVVKSGTGTTAQIEGIEVAGKTGTAQNVAEGDPHAWFIAFAPADNPQIAVAVFVESGGSFGPEATGAAVAAPMAKAMIEADRQISRW
jgi:peptidoglycan glycosyltransferase